ncbi:MAG: hypothetical protein KDE56_11820 [Anaerolineales bacterium]|nr:hypothetical protein [Anaerolineales bacterium]
MNLLLLTTYAFSLMQPGIGNPNLFNNYLVLGYGLMWLVGVGYLLNLASRQRNIKQDIELMKQILQEDEEPSAK